MTATSRAAGQPRTSVAARCAATATAIYGVLTLALSGFAGFLAGAALIAYHAVPVTIPGRLAAAAAALIVFAADRYTSSNHLITGWLYAHLPLPLPRRWDPRHTADRERYFQLDDQAGKLMRRLGRETIPAGRAALLDDLAAAEQGMADIYPDAFGPDPLRDEGGRDMAHSIALSAHLIRLAAAAEHDLAGTPVVVPVTWDPELDEHMACLRTERDHAVRAILLEDLCDAVMEQAGGQAAEVLASLARTERSAARRSA